jgi:hypothetical protein
MNNIDMKDIEYNLTTVDKIFLDAKTPIFVIKNVANNSVYAVMWLDESGLHVHTVTSSVAMEKELPDNIKKLFKTRFKFYKVFLFPPKK